MTREEAIHELQEDKRLYETEVCHAGDGSPDGRLLEALDMAIEALSDGNIARDIATILENEQDMRVILQNAERPKGEWIEVVRCKDCRRWYKKMNKCNRCPSISGDWGANDYCSYGERREESEDEE